MKIIDFIERLKDNCPSLARRVYGAAEAAAAKTNSMVTPVAFVIPMAESAKGSFTTGGHHQEITAQIGVLIAITNKTDLRGENAHDDIEKVRDEIRITLCAWQPPDSATPVDFVGGQLIGYDNYTMRWSDVFATNYYYRKVT